jgi:hypothetical protein
MDHEVTLSCAGHNRRMFLMQVDQLKSDQYGSGGARRSALVEAPGLLHQPATLPGTAGPAGTAPAPVPAAAAAAGAAAAPANGLDMVVGKKRGRQPGSKNRARTDVLDRSMPPPPPRPTTGTLSVSQKQNIIH